MKHQSIFLFFCHISHNFMTKQQFARTSETNGIVNFPAGIANFTFFFCFFSSFLATFRFPEGFRAWVGILMGGLTIWQNAGAGRGIESAVEGFSALLQILHMPCCQNIWNKYAARICFSQAPNVQHQSEKLYGASWQSCIRTLISAPTNPWNPLSSDWHEQCSCGENDGLSCPAT